MNYRLLVLMVALVGLVASGVIAGEMDRIDKKLAKEAPLFERAKMRGRLLVGMLPKPFDHAPQLEAARTLQNRPWPTTVDWDGRADYEKDKPAVAQPIMQHYLKRMKPWMYK